MWTGSHIDAVPNGGAFDGPLGSLAAIECLRRLHEERVELERPVRAIVYSDEEGNYAHLLGSSALTRGFTPEELQALTGRDGDRFADTFRAAGGISTPPRPFGWPLAASTRASSCTSSRDRFLSVRASISAW